MSTKKYVAALDIGTTSAKAVLFQKNGVVVAEHECSYPVYQPQPSWVEQDPYEIEQAAIRSLSAAIQKSGIQPSELICVSFSSAMHSLICVNEKHEAISPSITWADGRSVEQASRLKDTFGTDIYLQTGTPLHPMSPLCKLLWMRDTGYGPYVQAAKFVSIKEFLFMRWFGTYIVDYAIASASGLFNIHTFDWHEDALVAAGISKEQLSKPVPSTTICQGLSSELANRMSVSVDIPFVIGSSDGPLANLGIGAINPGDVALTIGTSGAIRQMSSSPRTDELQEIFCYGVTKDLWIMGGPSNNGGIVFQWMKDVFGEIEVERALTSGDASAYDLLSELAKGVKPGADGLLFLPFLNGERAPYWDANARGSYIGLTLAHKKAHMIRAGLEGVIFSMYSIGEALERLAGEPANLFASGGFARSSLWLQMVADIFGKEVQVPVSHQSSAWGAAWFGLYALGEVSSLSAIKTEIPMKETYVPNAVHHQVYRQLYETYRDLYAALKPHFHALATIQKAAK
ncbi:gluconokinase [Alkalihalobacillus sp. MEB130]|uniref:gluconokinase n=1 Tax=Alkalihalobacillus sp. MEB130 TaxID=2976704 RepID=UPI0028DE44B0|nr:gluconokinase [Alkalihalobacillus sp. MEB130]MDT8860398.1 gluconokinase [Alkalihalobacillus sp. MEB130]